MQDEPSSILTTIKYYKNILKFPSFPKTYSELDETAEQSELFFCNSKQRKEESLRLLKEWASNRMELFEKNREIVEELANSCDYRIRLSVDFLQIVYKFFNEKYFHEQQYSQFLLTKPQPALKQNPLSQQLYSTVGQAISSFEENNLKRCEKIGLFAHTIQTQILKAEAFQELSDMDKKLDLLLSTIITQKKLLQNYITAAGQKLNLIIQQFPQQQAQQRARRPIFDEQPEQQQQSRTEKILNNISALGTLFVGATSLQDPVELELNQQMKEQERQIREQQLKEEQSLSSGNESSEQKEEQSQNAQSNLQINDINEVLADVQSEQFQKEKVEKLSKESQDQQKENQAEQPQVQNLENQAQSIPTSYAQQYKQQQLLKERQQYELNSQKSKNYQSSQSLPMPQQQQQKPQEQQKKQPSDLYKLIISFVATQQYANKLLNQLAEKVVSYWKLVIEIENKRAQWAKSSCAIYSEGIKEIHQINIELNEISIDVGAFYHFQKLMPKEVGQLNYQDAEEFTQSLVIKEIGCQAARLLLVKEFKVHVIEKNSELPAILVLTIDKFVGCWYKHDETLEAVDNPVFHYTIAGMATQKVTESILDIMPSKHLLFLNIANDRQKSKVKFQSADDMEEFCTITQSK